MAPLPEPDARAVHRLDPVSLGGKPDGVAPFAFASSQALDDVP
jgi:hypothetical protein